MMKKNFERRKMCQKREVRPGDSWNIGWSQLRWTKILIARRNGRVWAGRKKNLKSSSFIESHVLGWFISQGKAL